MTITPKHVRAQIAASSGVLESLSRRLPPAVHAARLWMLDPVPEGHEKREDAGVRSKGHISDPTAVAALRELGHSERIFELFEANLDTLKLCLANLTQFADKWEPVDTEKRRCGEFTPREIRAHEWYTTVNRLGSAPIDCQRNADQYPNGSWHPLGLCPTHRLRWQELGRLEPSEPSVTR